MSTTDSLMPGDMQTAPERPKRSRFAGERLGAWLFAASFSVGIWGLALKVLSPSHPTPVATATTHYASLAPSGAADGRAMVLWQPDAAEPETGYPVTGGVPVTASTPANGPDSRPD